jgi:hypothetical protein
MGEDLSAIYRHDLPAPRAATRPVWPALLLLAALLLPLDIAVRRLVVTRYEWQRAWQRLRGWVSIRKPQPAAVDGQRAQQLSSLFRAKDRAGAETKPGAPGEAPAPPPGVVVPPPIVTRPPAEPAAPTAETPPHGAPVPAESARRPPAEPAALSAPPARPSGAPEPTATSAALLARKRARGKSDRAD